MTMQRRHFLMTPPALALGAAAAPIATLAAPTIMTPQSRILPRTGKGPRIVICGGGWGGMTAARYLRELIPDSDVVLLERNPTFWSGPMSNKWLVDVVDVQFLTFSYLDVAQKYGYHYIQTEVTAFEREKKRVITAQGWVDYDYLILGAGIRYTGNSYTQAGSLYAGRQVPSSTVFDAFAKYRFARDWEAQVNVDNLTNRRYLSGCDYNCYYGAERSITGKLSYRF